MYRIQQFDGLVLTDITRLHSGGSNDIGSGDALTSFSQLPGGGFFDNYGAGDSPQGIRPITRNCVLWGDTQADLITNFKALRGKIGRRGRLTVQFDDGELWWQWARLKRALMPRPEEAKGNFLPCTLIFESAAQNWYGIVQSGDTWSVGDDSFYLGDGTVSLGMNDYSFPIPLGGTLVSTETTLTTAGNTNARNMLITVVADKELATLSIRSDNGPLVQWISPFSTDNFTLTIDTGAHSCLARMDDDRIDLTLIRAEGATIEVQTSTAHGLASGDSVEITGTDYYDGVHHNINVTDTDELIITPLVPVFAPSLSSTGDIYPVTDVYSSLLVFNRADWFVLEPGNNGVTITYAFNNLPTLEGTIQFQWYEHFK